MIVIIPSHPKPQLTEPISIYWLPNSWDFAKGPFEI